NPTPQAQEEIDMDLGRLGDLGDAVKQGLSRRVALGRLAGGGAALVAAGFRRRESAAQAATPAAAAVTWQSLRLEVDFVPEHPVSITVAGGGPPQRGDWFFVDAPIYPAGKTSGTPIGVYQCFGAWTAAATAIDAPNQRLTSVQFHLADGMLMGIINEGGTTEARPNELGAVMGGAGAYANATGTFNQVNIAPKGGTPTPGASAVRSTFDLLVPKRR
ncbi:MAG TPA: hypothetical protein VFI22_13505, partial [Thermomicrobiales bacterium]|nr:hypothetical protein [Thermomicrobiales bacterium]